MYIRLRPTLFLLALFLASCSQSISDPTSPGGEQPATPLEGDALVLGPIDGEVADGITKSMRLTPYDGSQKLEDFDVVIFDGDAHTPDAVKAEPLVAQALRSGKWVLGLDVTEAHKTTGLGDFTLGVSKGDSPAYATRVQQDAQGRHTVDAFEYPNPDAMKMIMEDEWVASPALAAQTVSTPRIDSDAFVRSLVQRLQDKTVTPAQAGNIPAGLIYATFNYQYSVPWTISSTGRTGNSQTLNFTPTYTATVFLNNQNDPQGDFQYLLIDNDVSANPTSGTGNFANIEGKTPSHQCPGCAYDEVAWFQDQLIADVSPANDVAWELIGTSPETVNGVTEITTEVNFDIGFNQAEGGEGSFGYSNAVTRDITDWQVTNQSSAPNSGWYYRSQYPYDSDNNPYCGGQQKIYADGCYLNSPNELSLDTMQLHTQAVWRSPNVLTDWVTVNTATKHHAVDLYCNEDVLFACQDNKYKGSSVSINPSFQVNMAAVVPVPIASLTFDNDTPTAGQQVTGTVTLDSPAQVDTTINLQSNSDNATVLPNVTVSQGDISATFQIDTNANNLSSGNSTVATIDAFYAQNVQAQLTITAP